MEMATECSRNGLLRRICELSFVLDDMRLFLDTHPQCGEALAYYNRQARRRAEAISDYTRLYGPLRYYESSDSDEWQWVDDPWPWEGVN